MSRAAAADMVTGLYALALGAAGVMLTFIAVADGLSLAMIAALSAASAASQFVSRMLIGPLYRVLADRAVMAGALTLLMMSMIVVLLVPGVAGLAIAQLLQGISRSAFWSAAQLHVLRISAHPARGMGRNQFVANGLGAVGPVIAGVLASHDPRDAAWLVAGMSAAGAVACWALVALPVYHAVPRTPDNRVWTHHGVRVASFGSLAGGTFNAVIMTFAPVVFRDLGWSESRVGLVVGMANAGILVGALVGGRMAARAFSVAVTVATLVVASGVALLASATVAPTVAVIALIAAGAGTGAILTLSPTLASRSVPEMQRGHAVVFTGVFRAGALLGTPLVVSAAALAMPMTLAMLVVGALTAAPVLVRMWGADSADR